MKDYPPLLKFLSSHTIVTWSWCICRMVEDDTISHINTFQNTTASTQNWETKEDSTQSTETTDHPLKRVYNNLVFMNYMVLAPILCPFGIIGNSFVAYVLLKKKNSNSSFIYMTFILLADIVSLISDIFVSIGNGYSDTCLCGLLYHLQLI
jgi:hypothetical protein